MEQLSRLGLIGDVHQEHKRLELLLAYFAEHGVDRGVCVGDIADGVGDLGRCVQLLEESAVECVMGNHDRWLLRGTQRELPDALPVSRLGARDRAYLAALPKTRDYETPRGRLLLCHGMGENDMAGLLPEDDGYALESNFELHELIISGRYALIVAGHTHRTMVRRLKDTWFINPGTLRGDHGATSALLDVANSEVVVLGVSTSAVQERERVAIG